MKGAIVAALLAASNTFIAARRLVNGVDIRYARQAAPAAAWLTALVSMVLTAPLYALAQKLVFSKVRRGDAGRHTYIAVCQCMQVPPGQKVCVMQSVGLGLWMPQWVDVVTVLLAALQARVGIDVHLSADGKFV